MIHRLLLPSVLLLTTSLVAAEPISPEKAREFDGKEVTVQLTIKSGRNLLNEKQKIAYLNSEPDFTKKENLAIVIHQKAAEEMKASFEDPVVHFKGKTIKVTGKITITKDAVRLHVDKASQIEELEEKK